MEISMNVYIYRTVHTYIYIQESHLTCHFESLLIYIMHVCIYENSAINSTEIVSIS